MSAPKASTVLLVLVLVLLIALFLLGIGLGTRKSIALPSEQKRMAWREFVFGKRQAVESKQLSAEGCQLTDRTISVPIGLLCLLQIAPSRSPVRNLAVRSTDPMQLSFIPREEGGSKDRSSPKVPIRDVKLDKDHKREFTVQQSGATLELTCLRPFPPPCSAILE